MLAMEVIGIAACIAVLLLAAAAVTGSPTPAPLPTTAGVDMVVNSCDDLVHKLTTTVPGLDGIVYFGRAVDCTTPPVVVSLVCLLYVLLSVLLIS